MIILHREDVWKVMLDQKKIRLMTKMAIYEKNYGKEDIKISGYYKKDYTSLNTWATLIWITFGYLLVAALVFLCGADALLENLNFVKLLIIVAKVLSALVVMQEQVSMERVWVELVSIQMIKTIICFLVFHVVK